MFNRVFDLPSEHWQDLIECWICHSMPTSKENAADSSEINVMKIEERINARTKLGHITATRPVPRPPVYQRVIDQGGIQILPKILGVGDNYISVNVDDIERNSVKVWVV